MRITKSELMELMRNKQNIRHVIVIAPVDHGSSTMIDLLISKCGIIIDSSESTVTKFISASLHYTKQPLIAEYYLDQHEEKTYLINLLKHPTLTDHYSASFRISDGALLVTDCVEGLGVQHETLLRNAIRERVKFVLFVNKLDRMFLELSFFSFNEIYKNVSNIIECINSIASTYIDHKMGNIECKPPENKVTFGSALHKWGFTLNTFAKMYSSRFGIRQAKVCKKLWGENYWDPQCNKWVKTNTNGTLMRGFEQFILKPIATLYDAIINDKRDVYEAIVESLHVMHTTDNHKFYIHLIVHGYIRNAQKLLTSTIPDIIHDICFMFYGIVKSDKCCTYLDALYNPSLSPKSRLRIVMESWLPLDEALCDMMVSHLPPPIVAQVYRVENLYSGPLDTMQSQGIRKCDPNGAVAVYISKMLPNISEKGRFVAFGRVFSGTVKTGQEVRIMGPDYEFGTKNDLFVTKIKNVLSVSGRYSSPIEQCSAGNLCCIVGIDQYILKEGTLATSEDMHPFVVSNWRESGLNFTKIPIEPTNAADLPQFIKGLKLLERDINVKCTSYSSGQSVVEFREGVGELQALVILKDWKECNMKHMEIVISKPVITYCETVTTVTGSDEKYPKICVGKSPNKHNRIYMNAYPLNDGFMNDIEDGVVQLPRVNDANGWRQFEQELVDVYNWNTGEARKIWSFGCPPNAKTNCIVDLTKGVQFLKEIKDHVHGAFFQATYGGVLCDEVMRGIRYNITDCKLLSDAIHRGAGQIMPAVKRAMFAAQIASTPRLMEPINLMDITVVKSAQAGVFNTLQMATGEIEKIEHRVGTSLTKIQAYVPVAQSFDFGNILRRNTNGQAFVSVKFAHWKIVDSDPMEEGSDAYDILMDIRKRKGLKLTLPKFYDYNN